MKHINHDPEMRVYGSPRMTNELRNRGYQISVNTTAKLMKNHGISSKRKWSFKPPKTTQVDKTAKYCDNLIKNHPPQRFGQQIVADITYFPTKEGWLYLSVAMDLYTRMIVGWASSRYMPATLITQTLENATQAWKINTQSMIFHSDRGSQYTSHLVKNWLTKRGVQQSMSDRGNCYDNANCESFFSSLKSEILPECGYFETRKEAHKRIFSYIEGFYNTRRQHSALNYLSPLEFYLQKQNQLALAS